MKIKHDKFYNKLSWVSNTVTKTSIFLRTSSLISSILFFGFIPWSLLFIVTFLTFYNRTMFQLFTGLAPFSTTLPVLFAYCWLFFGPALIHKYETQYLPEFLWKTRKFISKSNHLRLAKLAAQFPHSFKLLAPTFAAMTMFMGLVMTPYARNNFFISGIAWLYYIVSILIMLLSMLVATFGVYGTVLTIKLIFNFSKYIKYIDVTDPSKRGGISFVMDFAIKTTILFGSGFAVVPFLYNLSVEIRGIGQVIGLILVATFLSLVLLTFVFPILQICIVLRNKRNISFQKYQNLLAGEFHKRFNSDSNQQENELTPIDVSLLVWYNQKLEAIRGFPIKGTVILQLLLTIGIPIIITVLQYHRLAK